MSLERTAETEIQRKEIAQIMLITMQKCDNSHPRAPSPLMKQIYFCC